MSGTERGEPEAGKKSSLRFGVSWLHSRKSSAASAPIRTQVARSTKIWAIITAKRAFSAALAGYGVENRQKRGVTGHPQINRDGLAADVHGVLPVLLPVGGELFVNDGVAGGRRKFEHEKKPQACAGQKCSDRDSRKFAAFVASHLTIERFSSS